MTSAKNVGNEMDDDGCEGSLGSTDGDNNISRDKPQFGGRKKVGTFNQQKGKKSVGKKVEVEDTGHHYGDDIKEACSGTEGGQKFGNFEIKHGPEARDVTFTRSSGQTTKRRSKKVLFGGGMSVSSRAFCSAFAFLDKYASRKSIIMETIFSSSRSFYVIFEGLQYFIVLL